MKLVFVQKLIGLCHSERPEEVKYLCFVGEKSGKSEIPFGPVHLCLRHWRGQGGLRRYCSQDDMLVRVSLP
jgi:hypothetical protein